MDFSELVEAVKREAKGDASREELFWFEDPRNRSTWSHALTAAIQDAGFQFRLQQDRLDRARGEVEAGLVSPDVYREISDRHDVWLKKASRYRLGLMQRRAEIQADVDRRIESLEGAVRRHRAARIAGDETADAELWQILDWES